jgi:hypothetical protein
MRLLAGTWNCVDAGPDGSRQHVAYVFSMTGQGRYIAGPDSYSFSYVPAPDVRIYDANPSARALYQYRINDSEYIVELKKDGSLKVWMDAFWRDGEYSVMPSIFSYDVCHQAER